MLKRSYNQQSILSTPQKRNKLEEECARFPMTLQKNQEERTIMLGEDAASASDIRNNNSTSGLQHNNNAQVSSSNHENSNQGQKNNIPTSSQYPFHVYDDTLPASLLSLFQQYFCKLCSVQFDLQVVGKKHYESKGHMKNVREFLVQYAKCTGEPPHQLLQSFCPTPANNIKVLDLFSTYCDVCNVSLKSGPITANAHFSGKSHLRNLLGNQEASLFSMENDFALPTQFRSKKEVMKNAFSCGICNITTTSKDGLDNHFRGKKHQAKMANNKVLKPNNIQDQKTTTIESTKQNLHENQALLFSIENDYALPTQFGSKKWVMRKVFSCGICNVTSTSKQMLKKHRMGKKHLANVAKVLKPNNIQDKKTTTIESTEENLHENQALLFSIENDFALPTHFGSKKGVMKNIFFCGICNVTSASKQSLRKHRMRKRHLANVANNKVLKPNNIQDKNTTTIESMEENTLKTSSVIHIVNSQKDLIPEEFQCVICNITFKQKINFDYHCTEHIPKMEKLDTITSCKACCISTNSLDDYQKHLESETHNNATVTKLSNVPNCIEDIVLRSTTFENQEPKQDSNFTGEVWCNACNIVLSSEAQHDLHVSGAQHQEQLKLTLLIQLSQRDSTIKISKYLQSLPCSLLHNQEN